MRRRYLDGPSMNCGYDQHPNTAKWNLQRERGEDLDLLLWLALAVVVREPAAWRRSGRHWRGPGVGGGGTALRRAWRRSQHEAEEESAGHGWGGHWRRARRHRGGVSGRRRSCRLRRRSRSIMTTGCGGGAESTRGARRWRRSGQRASRSWSWSRGVGPTGVGSPEVALRVEEEAWVNLAACRRLSQILWVRVQARATGSFYMWSTVATD
jgi:hypothetical protein